MQYNKLVLYVAAIILGRAFCTNESEPFNSTDMKDKKLAVECFGYDSATCNNMQEFCHYCYPGYEAYCTPISEPCPSPQEE
mmetsp:Transcript_5379/g.8864  ORF Transcript_5379/g.8864 Transcript_5379/m.8864 type:complete len:81 (+) Transcript_5379:20-262(+)